MSERIDAIVNRELLVWARENSHLSQLEVAHKIHVSEELLKSWEEGDRFPTINQLRELGGVYKRPIAIFYLPEPPKEFTPIKDYRRFANTRSSILSSKLQFETRLAQNRREIAIELYENLGYEIPKPPQKVSVNDEPENLASEIRKKLSISRDQQLKISNERDAFLLWRTAIENQGVLVFEINDVDIKEIRGFSISEIPLPVISVNNKDSRRGRIFTLLHEYIHILLREHGLCDFYEGQRNNAKKRVEVFCNRVAGAILVPQKYFLLEEPVLENKPFVEWEDKHISELADKYTVSREVIIRRLLILDRITPEFYQSKIMQYEQEYAQFNKPKKDWFPLPHYLVVNTAGVPFTRLVIDNYYNKKITAIDVSDFLDVKLKHIKNIESLVRL